MIKGGAMTKSLAPVKEIGYSQAVNYNWWLYEDESTPELQWPQSIAVYDAMRRTDAQCASVLKAVTLLVRCTPWRLDPNGARDEVVEFVAEDLGLPIVGRPVVPPRRTKDKFSWSEHLRLALLMLPFGHAMFEQVYRVDEDGQRAHLRKLALRPSKTIERIDVAPDGGLISIKQYWTKVDEEPRPIPVDRLVAYVNDREGGNWLGQALALDTPIPTPDGWRAVGELRPGDRVFDETGTACSVTATRRWADRPCYRVQFDDGEEIVADANHQWQVHTYRSRNVPNARGDKSPELLTTEQMVERGVRVYGRMPNHALALAGALELPDVDLPVDPYVLGAWLGDGSMNGGSARLCDAEGDVAAEFARRGYPTRQSLSGLKSRSWEVTGLVTGLRAAGLVEGSDRRKTVAWDKHVPAIYLRASARQRLDLLRGLMDTDGHFDSANGQCNFNNTNKALADAVVELANGLGAKTKVQYVRQAGAVAVMKSGALIKSQKDIYRVKFTAQFIAFNMERKAKQQDLKRAAKRPFHYVHSIEVEPNQDTVCIEVDSPSHLFLCGIGHKPTHNSILRGVYKNWLLKDRLLRVQAQTIERNGMGVPLYKAAETETELATGLGMATSWRAGEAAGSAIPFGADLVLRGVEGTLPDAEPAIRYHDEQIARQMLAHFLNLGTQTGSWALGTTFADFFTLSVQTVAESMRDTATQHVVEDLVDVNWGTDEPAPKLVFDQIGSQQAATAAALKTLVDAGVIHPDQVLEESSRQQYGLPAADEASTFTAPAAEVSQDGPPAAAEPKSPADRPGSVAAAGDVGPKGSAAMAAPDPDEDDDFTDEEALQALIAALAEYSGEVAAKFNESLHPRNPKGSAGGGRFRSLADRIVDAITHHHGGNGKGDPFEGFDRPQLMKVAKSRGISLKRGESRDSIALKLLADVNKGRAPKVGPDKPKKRAPRRPHVGDPATKVAELRGMPEMDARDALDDMTRDQVYDLTKHLGERGQSRARKRELVDLVLTHHGGTEGTSASPDNVGYDGPRYAPPADIDPDVLAELRDLYVRDARGELTMDDYRRMTDLMYQVGDMDRADVDDISRWQQEAGIQGYLDNWRKDHPGFTDEELKGEFVRRSREAFAGKKIAVRVTDRALLRILEDGRIKTQFETNTSNGLVDERRRAHAELQTFGLDIYTNPRERPVYGYVAVEGVRASLPDDALSQYGRVQIVLKDAVRRRTTAMWGDSMNLQEYGIPSPVNDPDWMSYTMTRPAIATRPLDQFDRDVLSEQWRTNQYVEAQIHGGLGVDDIEEVILTKQPIPNVRRQLEALGLSWRVLA